MMEGKPLTGTHLKNEFDRRGVRFMVGRNSAGAWIVCDRDLVGGTFPDRAAAIQFAMSKSNHQPGAVCCVSDILSFDPSLTVGKKLPQDSLFKSENV